MTIFSNVCAFTLVQLHWCVFFAMREEGRECLHRLHSCRRA